MDGPMNSEFRRNRRDPYFVSSRVRKPVVIKRTDSSWWVSLALIVVALVVVRVLVDFI